MAATSLVAKATNAELKEEESKTVQDPGQLYPPIKVQGTTFELRDSGLTVTTESCFAKTKKHTILWGSLEKCDLQFGCLGKGELHLTEAQPRGTKTTIPGWSWKLREAATVIYQQMNKGVTTTVDMDVIKKLGKSPEIQVLGNGVVVKKSTGCCKGISTFVPWSQVVSLSLSKGWFFSSMKMSTMVREDDVKKTSRKRLPPPPARKAGETPSSASPPAEPLKESHDGPQFVEVSISGWKETMGEVFECVGKLMRLGEHDTTLPDAPATKYTTISSAGVTNKTMSKDLFVPWRSITTVDYTTPLFGSGSIKLTDRVGEDITLKGFDQKGYAAFRELFTGSSKGEEADSIVRKNLRITQEGVSIGQRHMCSYVYHFHPWSEIDACEVVDGCCSGSIYLISETGVKIEAYSSMFNVFNRTTFVEILKKMREMKYQKCADPEGDSSITFAGRKGDSRACVLSDVALRITARPNMCKTITCLLDLDSVKSCDVVITQGCMKKTFLLIYIDKTMGSSMAIENVLKDQAAKDKIRAPGMDEQLIMIKLSSGDNARQIKDEINQRARSRQGSQK